MNYYKCLVVYGRHDWITDGLLMVRCKRCGERSTKSEARRRRRAA